MDDQRRLSDNQRDQLRQIYRERDIEMHPDETVEVEIGEAVSAEGTVSVRITRTAHVKVPKEWIPYERG